MGLMNQLEAIVDVGEKAEKEFNIECMLKEMYA